MIKRDIIVVLGCAYMALILSGHIGSGIMAIYYVDVIYGIFAVLCSLIPWLAMLFVIALKLEAFGEEIEE